MKERTTWTERGLGIFVVMTVIFSAFPLLIIFPVSLNPAPMLAFPEKGLTLKWYQEASQFKSGFPAAFLNSFLIAAIATGSALTMGSLAAWVLTRHPFRGSSLVEAFFLSPLVLARVVYGVAVLIVFSRMGLIRSVLGLIIAHTVVVMPYVIRVVGSSLLGIRPALEEAASLLGANHPRVMWHVTLPLVRPGLVAAGVFSFISSIDEFTMTIFLVGPRVTTLPVQLFRHVELVVDPTVAAVSIVMILISAMVIAVVEKTIGLERVLAQV